MRTKATEAGEEFAGRGDVTGNLRAEFVGAGEFLFVAEALPELYLDAARGDFGDGFEDVSLDADGGAVKGGSNANVCDGAAGARFAFEESASDVDAAGRKEFLLGGEIECGESEAAAGASAGHNFSREDKRTAEQAGGTCNFACCDFATDQRAGDGLAVVDDLRNDNDVEAALRAELAEEGCVA